MPSLLRLEAGWFLSPQQSAASILPMNLNTQNTPPTFPVLALSQKHCIIFQTSVDHMGGERLGWDKERAGRPQADTQDVGHRFNHFKDQHSHQPTGAYIHARRL